jgi:hypothetical protein
METIFSSIVILASLFALIFLFVIVQDLWRQRSQGNAGTGLASDGNPRLAKHFTSRSNILRGYDSPELYHGDTLLARCGVPREEVEMPISGRHPIILLYELVLSGTIPADALDKLLMDQRTVTEAEIMKILDEQRPRRQDMLKDRKESTAKPGRKND